MLTFNCDYDRGAHPAILQRLTETNRVSQPGYGRDEYSAAARDKIRAAFACPQSDVWFLVGGTETNAIVIDTLLNTHEGVIAAETGHVSVHEAGAIEHTGHKVLTLPGYNGKLKAEDVAAYLRRFYADESWQHMVMTP